MGCCQCGWVDVGGCEDANSYEYEGDEKEEGEEWGEEEDEEETRGLGRRNIQFAKKRSKKSNPGGLALRKTCRPAHRSEKVGDEGCCPVSDSL